MSFSQRHMFNKVLSYIFVTGEGGWFAFLTLSVTVPKYLDNFKLFPFSYNVAFVKQTVGLVSI